MPISPYLRDLRRQIGPALIVLPSVAALIRDEADRVLLVLDASTGGWVTPGGAVDPDEEPTDALRREVREETGLDVEPTELAGVHGGPAFRVRYRNGDEVSYVLLAYRCVVLGGAPEPDGDETVEVAWVSAEALAGLPHPAWLDRVLADLLADRPGLPLAPPPRRAAR